MAKEIVLQIAVNAANGVQTLNDLQKNVKTLKQELAGKAIGSKEFNELTAEISKSNAAIKILNQSSKSIDGASPKNSIGAIKQEIKDLTIALNNVEQGSPIAKKLEADLSIAKGELAEFKQRTEGLSGDELAAGFARVGEGIAGAFGIATNALSIFGQKNEDVSKARERAEKAIAVVISAKAVAEGIENGVKLVSIGQTRLATVATNLETAAQSKNIIVKQGATIAMRLLNAAMAANPILLVVGALATLGTALAVFGERTDEATEKQNKLKAEMESEKQTLETFDKAFNSQSEKIVKGYDRQIAILKSKSGTEEQVYKLSREKIQAQINLLNFELGYLGKLSDAQKDALNDLKVQLQVLDNEEANRRKEKDQKAKDEAQKAADEQFKIAQQLATSRANLIGDSLQKEIALEKIGLNDKLNAIRGNSAKEIALRESLIIESNTKIKKLIADNIKEVENLQSKLNVAQAGNAGEDLFLAKKAQLESELKSLQEFIKKEEDRIKNQNDGQPVDQTKLLQAKLQLAQTQNELSQLTNNFSSDFLANLNDANILAIESGKNYVKERKKQLEELLKDENLPAEKRKEYIESLGILNQAELNLDDGLKSAKIKQLEDLRDAEIANAEATGQAKLDIIQKYQIKIDELNNPDQAKINSENLAKAELGVLQTSGAERLAAEKSLLDEKEKQELEAAGNNQAKRAEIEERYRQLRIELDENATNVSLSIAANALGTLSQLFKEDTLAYKSLAVGEATINTYLAATRTLNDKTIPNTFARIAAMVVVIGGGLAQVAKISGVQLAKGGILDDPSLPGNSTSDSIPARLSKGESVINARSTAMFKPVLSAINEMGGGRSFYKGGIALSNYALGGIAASSPQQIVQTSIQNNDEILSEIRNMKQNPAPVVFVQTEANDFARKFDINESRASNPF